MGFSSFYHDGQEYDLSHLAPFSWTYVQAANAEKGLPEKRYRCIIEFSGHCFTKSPNKRKQETLADFPTEYHYTLTTQKNRTETRLFCPERYRCSLLLPDILKELDKRKCFFTSADDKFLTVEIIDEMGNKLNYEIYFSLKKSTSAKHDVHIYINSAYVRDEHETQSSISQNRKAIKLFTLLHNTLTGKRIKKPC